MPNCTMSNLFQDFSLVFFFLNVKRNFGIGGSANGNRRTKKRYVNMPGAIINLIITSADTKFLEEKMKWKVRVLKVFTLS